MDISKISETLSDFFSNNKLEITCVLAASAAYHVYQHSKTTKTTSHSEKTEKKNFGTASRMSTHIIKSERVESSVVIPKSILESENSLIDEVQHLYNPACRITKVPHLILELVLVS